MAEWPPNTGHDKLPPAPNSEADLLAPDDPPTEVSSQDALHDHISAVGWEAVFELQPPGIAEAYKAYGEHLEELRDQLLLLDNLEEAGEAESPEDHSHYALALYVRVLDDINSHRREYGIWWGLPTAERRQVHDEFDAFIQGTPLTANQRERLLDRYDGGGYTYASDYIEELIADDVWVLHEGQLVPSPDRGEASMTTWDGMHSLDRQELLTRINQLLQLLPNARSESPHRHEA